MACQTMFQALVLTFLATCLAHRIAAVRDTDHDLASTLHSRDLSLEDHASAVDSKLEDNASALDALAAHNLRETQTTDALLEEWLGASNTSGTVAGMSYLALQQHLERLQSSSGGFNCPWPCLRCCMAESEFYVGSLGKRDTTKFKCIFNEKYSHYITSKTPNHITWRRCSAPTKRNSDPGIKKTYCYLTSQEQTLVGSNLPECRMVTQVQDYTTFLGSCPAMGLVVERMYFHLEHSLFGGVCSGKATEFQQAGRVLSACLREKKCTDAACKSCVGNAKTELCDMLKSDKATGRMDKFSVAIWAAGVGAEMQIEELPRPVSTPRPLQKITIPGWHFKDVAWEAPADDYEIALAGGGFQCMMLKLQGQPLIDDMTATRNLYKASESPQNTNYDYFARYGLYQQPLHFPVPAEEILTDKTLSRLVFEAVGAHRLEFLQDGKPAQSLNPMVPLLKGPVTGLPEDARFAVRMEGLFEDLPLRSGMARWGGNAYFAKDGTLVGIQYAGETVTYGTESSDQAVLRKREYFKFVFRSSLVSTVTAFDHLVATHILVSEVLALSTMEMLPPTHVLRMLIFPHIYKTLDINFKAANNLFPKNMLVHRASPYADAAFSSPSSDGLLWQKSALLKFRTFYELYVEYQKYRHDVPEMPELPYFEDGMLLYQAIKDHVNRVLDTTYGKVQSAACDASLVQDNDARRFVLRFFDLNDHGTPDFYPQDFRWAADKCPALASLLTEMIFLVSGWHTHVGSVPDFFRDTRFAATAWKEGELQPRPKHSLLMMLLAATTAAEMPTFGSDYQKVFKNWGGLRGMPNWQQLFADMNQVQGVVHDRNEGRIRVGHLPFHQMEPKHVQLGVYV